MTKSLSLLVSQTLLFVLLLATFFIAAPITRAQESKSAHNAVYYRAEVPEISQKPQTVKGEVTKVEKVHITVKTESGEENKYQVLGNIDIRRNGNGAELFDMQTSDNVILKVGERGEVREIKAVSDNKDQSSNGLTKFLSLSYLFVMFET